MKVRTGFVSNSSSSSFLIPAHVVIHNNLNTLKVLHPFLLKQKQELEESLSWGEAPNKTEQELVHNAYNSVLEWIANNKNTYKNPTFKFASCNYDTYIWKLKNGDIQINTCNNVDWDEAIDEVGAVWKGHGSDDGDWPDFPMCTATTSTGYKYKQPDETNTVNLNLDTKYQDLPVLFTTPEKKDRFVALLEELDED